MYNGIITSDAREIVVDIDFSHERSFQNGLRQIVAAYGAGVDYYPKALYLCNNDSKGQHLTLQYLIDTNQLEYESFAEREQKNSKYSIVTNTGEDMICIKIKAITAVPITDLEGILQTTINVIDENDTISKIISCTLNNPVYSEIRYAPEIIIVSSTKR